MKALFIAAAAVAVTMGAPSAFAGPRVYTVGADSGCTHHSLQAALDEASRAPGTQQVRVARNMRHRVTSLATVYGDLQLVGGFSNCSDTTPLGVTRVTVASVEASERLASHLGGGVRLDTARGGAAIAERSPSAR